MTFWLLDHQNPNAPVRDDGRRFWGYASRSASVRLLVIHTTENAFDTDANDTGAENVASYQSVVERPSSYHDIVDSDSHVKCLPWHYTAFGVRGYNSVSISVAFAGRAADWGRLSDEQVDARLRRMARVVAEACRQHDIPVRRISGDMARASNASGICGHTDLDPDRRSDPGSGFPWARFIHLVQKENAMAEHDHDLTEKPAWGTAYWDTFVQDGVTSAPDSWKRMVHRIDLAWVYSKTIRPLKAGVQRLTAEVSALTDRVTALENRSSGGGLTRDEVDEMILARLKPHSANPDAHHD